MLTPTFTTRADIPIVGLAQPFKKSEGVDGPAVWRRFRPFVDRIPNQAGSHTLGLNEVVDMEAGELIYAPAVEGERHRRPARRIVRPRETVQ